MITKKMTKKKITKIISKLQIKKILQYQIMRLIIIKKDLFADLVGSIPTEQFNNFMINQNWKKLDGIYVKEDPENIPIDIYNKKGNKLGKYISALLRQEGIDGYDKNGNKFEGKFRKYVTDGPVEDFMIQIEIN